jgi:hypothetical protein
MLATRQEMLELADGVYSLQELAELFARRESLAHHASGRWLEYDGAGRTQWRTITLQLESHSFSSMHQYARPPGSL